MILFDASGLVPLFIVERDSSMVRDLAAGILHPALDTLARGEVHATFARLVRDRKLPADELADRRAWFADWQQQADVVPVEPLDIDLAARFVADPYPALRMPDAIHLAVAARIEAPIFTLDVGMRRAAEALSIAVFPLPS